MRSGNRPAAPVHRIGEGATLEGTLRFSGRLEIDGTVAGSIIAEPEDGGEVVVGPKGSVQGQLSAAVIEVAGKVQGPVRSSRRLDILPGARVHGDLVYRDLQVQHGAIVEGSLKPLEGDQVPLKLVANSRI